MRYGRPQVFLIFCFLFLPRSSNADLVPRNQKLVDYEVIIENAAKYDLDFYLYPTGATFDKVQSLVVKDDGLIRTTFYRNSPPYIFAFPKSDPSKKQEPLLAIFEQDCEDGSRRSRKCFSKRMEKLKESGVSISQDSINGLQLVPKKSDIVFIETRYLITEIEKGVVSLKKSVHHFTKKEVEAERKRKKGMEIRQAMARHRSSMYSNPWPPLLLPFFGLAGLFWLKRQEKVEQ